MVHLNVRVPGPLITRSDDGAAFGPGFANGSWLTIRGFDLSSTTRLWQGSAFQGNRLPTTLDGVRVTIRGRLAYVYFASPRRVWASQSLATDEIAISGRPLRWPVLSGRAYGWNTRRPAKPVPGLDHPSGQW